VEELNVWLFLFSDDTSAA